MSLSFKDFLEENKIKIDKSQKFSKIDKALDEEISSAVKRKKYRPMKRTTLRKDEDKKKDFIKVYSRRREYDFLKYYSVVKYWASVNYDMSVEDIELLLHFYSEPIFTKREFTTYSKATLFKRKRIEDFIESDLIEELPGNEKIRITLNKTYRLSHKGKRRVSSIYKKLMMEEEISTERFSNKIFINKDASAKDLEMRKLVKEMNKKRADLIAGNYGDYFEDEVIRPNEE